MLIQVFTMSHMFLLNQVCTMSQVCTISSGSYVPCTLILDLGVYHMGSYVLHMGVVMYQMMNYIDLVVSDPIRYHTI